MSPALTVFTNTPSTTATLLSGTTAPAPNTPETWTMTSATGFPVPVTGFTKFHIADPAAPSELVEVDTISGSWSVIRGVEGTIPVPHATGATWQLVVSAGDLGLSMQAINVLSYGAVADNGVTDNLTAFNKANTAAVASGLPIWIPGATSGYGLSADWAISAGVRVFGAGAFAFKSPGTSVPTAGGFYGTVLMPTNAAAFTNAVVTVGTNAALENICVVGNISGWTPGNAPSSHNAPRAVQLIGRGARGTHVLGWGGLACAIDVGDGTGGNVAQDATLIDCIGNNSLNPPNVITVAGCSWATSSTTITTTGNFTTAGITVGMTISPGFNGLPLGAVVTAVGTTTLTLSNSTFSTNAGPVSLEFIGGIGIRLASSTDAMLTNCRTSSAPFVVAGGNADTTDCHWSAGSTTTNWFPVYCQTTGGFKSSGDVFDCATNVAGLIRRDRGIVQLSGPRFQNLNNTGTALPAMKDNEAAGVSVPGAWHIEGGTFTVGTAGSPDGFSYLIDWTGSNGNPALSSVFGVTIDSGAMQHNPTIYNGGTPGISRGVLIGANPLSDLGGQPEPWLPSDNGLLAANMDFALASATKTAAVGVIYLQKVQIRNNFTWTNVLLSVATIGVGASTGTFVGLYNSAGTLLSGSADWGASALSLGAKSIALTTPQALLAGTFVWVAIVCNLATTQVSLQASGAGVGASNLNLTATGLRFAVNGSGVALPGSITPASNTGTGSLAFAVAAS